MFQKTQIPFIFFARNRIRPVSHASGPQGEVPKLRLHVPCDGDEVRLLRGVLHRVEGLVERIS